MSDISAHQGGDSAKHADGATSRSIGASAAPRRIPILPMIGDHGSLIVASLALAVSAVTAVQASREREDSSKRTAITSAYDKWLEVSQMQVTDWQVAHLFALPEQYDRVSSLVAASSRGIEATKQAELELRERGLAVYLFTLFEATLYQWEQAVTAGDSRAPFYKAVLDYQTGRQLRNPRLLFLWESRGLKTYFEKATIDYYTQHVTVPGTQVDSIGPFASRP